MREEKNRIFEWQGLETKLGREIIILLMGGTVPYVQKGLAARGRRRREKAGSKKKGRVKWK